jgi:hypothetical protein
MITANDLYQLSFLVFGILITVLIDGFLGFIAWLGWPWLGGCLGPPLLQSLRALWRHRRVSGAK